MTKHFTLLSLIILSTTNLFPFNLKDYEVPADLKATLDAHKDHFPNKSTPAKWLPNFHIKPNGSSWDYGRLRGLDNGKKTVAEHHKTMNLIKFPIKYLYYGQVIAQRIQDSGKRPNLEQSKQLANFAMETAWDDSHADNFIVGNDGYVYIIDTEEIKHKKSSIDYNQAENLTEDFEIMEKEIRFHDLGLQGVGAIREAVYWGHTYTKRKIGKEPPQDTTVLAYLNERLEQHDAERAVEWWVYNKLKQDFREELRQERIKKFEAIEQKETDQRMNHIESLMDYQ